MSARWVVNLPKYIVCAVHLLNAHHKQIPTNTSAIQGTCGDIMVTVSSSKFHANWDLLVHLLRKVYTGDSNSTEP